MTPVGLHSSARESLPDLHSLIIARRSDVLAIRGPGRTNHAVGMTRVGLHVPGRESLPDLHGSITARGSDVLAVRGPGRTIHEAGMTPVGHSLERRSGCAAGWKEITGQGNRCCYQAQTSYAD